MQFNPESVPANSDIISSPLRNNFNTLATILAGQLGNDNFGSSDPLAISKLATTGQLSGNILFLGSNLTIQASKTANQAQSVTTTYFTITGIADEDSGWIIITAGGNMPADRVMRQRALAWYRTGGVMNISAGSSQPIDINATSAALTLLATGSSGNILIQVTTSAFGAGAFKGNVHVKCASLSAGMTIS